MFTEEEIRKDLYPLIWALAPAGSMGNALQLAADFSANICAGQHAQSVATILRAQDSCAYLVPTMKIFLELVTEQYGA